MAKPQPVYQVDRTTSQQRANYVQIYLTNRIAKTWREEMVFTSYPECKPSAERRGAESFEGQGYARCFDLSTDDGVAFRVLVVPMEGSNGGGSMPALRKVRPRFELAVVCP